MSYSKLVVDKKTIYVFEDGKIPKEITKLKHLFGIKFKVATEKERQPFIELERKLFELKNQKSNNQ